MEDLLLSGRVPTPQSNRCQLPRSRRGGFFERSAPAGAEHGDPMPPPRGCEKVGFLAGRFGNGVHDGLLNVLGRRFAFGEDRIDRSFPRAIGQGTVGDARQHDDG